MRVLLRIGTFALQSIWRNLWLSFVTFTVFVLTLVTVNAVLFVNVIARGAVNAVAERVQVAVYFNPQTSDDMKGNVREYVLSLPQVKTVDIVSADEALEQFRSRHENDPLILAALEEVGTNPFGDALLISANDPKDFPFILEAVERPEFTSAIKDTDSSDYENAISVLNTIATRIRYVGIALSVFFMLVAILIIFNSIRVAIYVHRDEIAIMKLVGAKDWFVRAPFLLETFLLSLLASAVVIALVLGLSKTLDAPIQSYFGAASISVWEYFSTHGLYVFGLQFVVLTVVSLLTTWLAMRRHLRV